MKNTFTVCTYGYSQCPQFTSLSEARAFLKEIVRESLQKAKHRGHKQARKHKLDTDCYRITLGPDRESAMYSQHCITN